MAKTIASGGEAQAVRQASVGRASFWLHLHPLRVRAESLHVVRTWGLGIAALSLLLILTFSGLLLALHYSPQPSHAHDSLRDIHAVLPFGAWLQTLHRLATQALLVVVGAHLLRVYLGSAYRGRRLLNWYVGLGLGVLVLGLAFTGYVLPWDRRAYWAGTIGADMLALVPGLGPVLRNAIWGEAQLGAVALLRFYVLHVMVLPVLILSLLVMHLWRLRKDGGLAPRIPYAQGPGEAPTSELKAAEVVDD